MPYPIYPQDLFHEVWELPGRTGTPYALNGERQYARRWKVRCKQKGLGPIAVCTAPTIPRPGAFYVSADGLEYDTNALLNNLSAVENATNDDWGDYEVTGSYGTRQLQGGSVYGPGGQSARDDPTQEWPTIRWGSELMEVLRYTDQDGNPFVTSAGQQIADAAARMNKLAVTTLSITRNELAFNHDKAEDYSYALNNQPFLGRKRFAVMCMPPTADAVWRGTFQYWKVSYTLKFFPRYAHDRSKIGGFRLQPRSFPGAVESEQYINSFLNTWQPLVLDAGTEEYKRRPGVDSARGCMNITAKWRTPIFVRNMPVSGPVLLNGEGQQLLPDDQPAMRPYFIPFNMYPVVDMVSLIDRGFA